MEVMAIEIKTEKSKNTLMKPYLKDINNLKKSDTWKTATNFISSKDNDQEHVMHSKSDNKETMTLIKQINLSKNFFNHFFLGIKFG